MTYTDPNRKFEIQRPDGSTEVAHIVYGRRIEITAAVDLAERSKTVTEATQAVHDTTAVETAVHGAAPVYEAPHVSSAGMTLVNNSANADEARERLSRIHG